jgi:hypothetical protein
MLYIVLYVARCICGLRSQDELGKNDDVMTLDAILSAPYWSLAEQQNCSLNPTIFLMSATSDLSTPAFAVCHPCSESHERT